MIYLMLLFIYAIPDYFNVKIRKRPCNSRDDHEFTVTLGF